MPTRIAVENVALEMERAKAYLQERLPPEFKVKGEGLTEVTTLGTEIQTAIREEATTGEIHDKARVHRNAKIDEFYDFRVACRRAVALEYGTDSPEYAAIPWSEQESTSKPEAEQPEDNP